MYFRKKLIFVLVFGMIFSLCACKKAPQEKAEKNVPEVTGDFLISVLDTGKSDAMFLSGENATAVIDCGEKGDAKKLLAYLSEKNIKRIDYLFITHFDRDHVGGAAKLIENTEIGKIITPDYEGQNKEYEDFLKAVSNSDAELTRLSEDLSFTLDDCLFEVFAPQKQTYKESDNDFSLAVSVTHGENTFLFAGDAEDERLSEFPRQFNVKHDFLKVPHHGKYSDRTKAFLKDARPEIAVITCSEKNPPDKNVVDLLNSMGAEVFLTENGTVEIKSDGEKITASQEN